MHSQRKSKETKIRPKCSIEFSLKVLIGSIILYNIAIFYRFATRTIAAPTTTMESEKSMQLHRFSGIKNQKQTPVKMKRDKNLPRILALVFPQFHSDPLNDGLWGKGFTDWNNLRNAPKQNRLGLNIPQPTEMGFYDLTQVAPRKKQGDLANEYGVDGFIYHHYWFYDNDHPGPTLNAPLEAMLKDGYPDTPFALDWVALKWDKSWHGKVREDFVFKEPNVLQKQYFPSNYTDAEITKHYNWLRQFFHHPNYIKVDGEPLFMIYTKKPQSFPVLERLRELAKQDGLPGLYIPVGFHRPHAHLQPDIDLQKYSIPKKKRRTWNGFNRTVAYPAPSEFNEKTTLNIPNWCSKDQLEQDKGHPIRRIDEIPGVITSFDNTPRRNYEDAFLWSGDQPDVVVERFRKSLYAATYYESCCFQNVPGEEAKEDDDRFIIINAFNEWAEGMTMEPSDVFGRRFLETVRDVKLSISTKGCD